LFFKYLWPSLTYALGLLERYFTSCYSLRLYINVGLTGYYSGSHSTSLQSTIFSALAIVVQQHPVLSTVFINESPSNIFYGRLPEIDLSKIVTFVQRQKPYTGAGADLESDGLLEKQHDTGFEEMNGTAPFWRLMILTDSTASPKPSFAATFICHHSVGDGVSVVAFHKSFLAALQTINGSLSSTIVQSPKTPMLPTVEDVLKMPVSAKHFLKKVSSELFLPTSKNLWIAEPIKVLTTSHFQSVVISPDITSSFVARCKENDTTVTATIQTVIAAALFQLLPAKFSTLQCNLSVSLRRWLPDPINEKSIAAGPLQSKNTILGKPFLGMKPGELDRPR
jgi:hypothetical protein